MIVPDQSHLNQVRDALWKEPYGCASVMVGSGFSRNAIKASPSSREFPLWHDTASALCSKLYPLEDGERLKKAKAEASGTSGFLRLAQEYQAAFGREPLHDFIKELVPDNDYVPGDLHIRLLRLPWRDVFTTNWDTLLERTCPKIAERAYSVVSTQQQIPSSPSPRIIKLHGSFPAYYPLIYTEEDFRTYPIKFAPFVNTVQQAMMETIFLLVGFSGDDPNFLHWSGWVRDNLGESTPKIYLAGWLDLSPHRRRMLEERNVIPIDIAQHPNASNWPDNLRHQYATEWLLHTLEYGQPYNKVKWPSPQVGDPSSVPPQLEPVAKKTVEAPQKELKVPSESLNSDKLTKVFDKQLDIWEHNRKIYPGWLILSSERHLLFESLLDWEHFLLKSHAEISPEKMILVLREIVWRYEKLLTPLSIEFEEVIKATLDKIDCHKKTRLSDNFRGCNSSAVNG